MLMLCISVILTAGFEENLDRQKVHQVDSIPDSRLLTGSRPSGSAGRTGS